MYLIKAITTTGFVFLAILSASLIFYPSTTEERKAPLKARIIDKVVCGCLSMLFFFVATLTTGI